MLCQHRPATSRRALMISLAGSSASRLRSFEYPAVSGDGLAQRGEPLVVFKLVASQDVGEAF